MRAGTRRALGILAVAATGTSIVRPAAAHGGPFRADQLRVDLADERHIVVRSDVWGLVETRDGGGSWHWTCAEIAKEESSTVLRRPFGVAPGGNVLIGSGFDGLFRAEGSLCAFTPVSFFVQAGRCGAGDCVPYDVTVDAPRGSVVVVTAVFEGTTYKNLLWKSGDGGTAWSQLGTPLRTDVSASAGIVAPSDANVVYAAGTTVTAPPEFFVFHSEDGGTTWQEAALPVEAKIGDLPTVVRLPAVHPTDPNVVFAWLDRDGGDRVTKAPDQLFASVDGGATFRRVFQAKNDLPGLMFSEDGTRVLLGATDDGLLSASIDDIRNGVAEPFHVVNDGLTWGLARISGGLLAGRDDFADPSLPRMSLGLSKDEGVTFEPFLVICDVGLTDCSAGTPAGDQCPGRFFGDQNFQFDQQLRRCAAPDAGDGGDAGPVDPRGDGAQGGCGCRVSSGRSSTSRGTVLLLLGTLASVAGRRRTPRIRRRSVASGPESASF